MIPIRALIRLICAVAVTFMLTTNAGATWSIVLADEETNEVAVGTVTCLNNYDLLAIVPVVVVGKGGAAVQASGDFDGIRRPIIFDHLQIGTPPEEILQMLATIPGHQSRQYGIVDTQGRKITFTGANCFQWAGGVVGVQGSLHYAIQGNILAGDCVVPAIEQAILDTDGDIPARLMAGMEAARVNGGDGRCSCSPGDPTGCGCPPGEFDKSGHIGGMVVARIGDTDDDDCDQNGCVDGDYFMRLNVAFQGSGEPDPVLQLQALFDDWRADLNGRPDAIQSTAAIDPPHIPPNGVSRTTMHITLLDWQGEPISVDIESLTVEHAPDSAGLSTIGEVVDYGDGTYSVNLTAGEELGVDRFHVTADDGVRPVILMPLPMLEYLLLGDINYDRVVNTADLLMLLAAWGDCPDPPELCPADINGDGTVNTADLLLLLATWGELPAPPCPWDLNDDGVVDELDRDILMEHWGDCPDPPEECLWDFNGDGVVDFQDLNELLDHYGPCPE
jgi:hypothetical protein